ncbi:N-chimaerin [Bulinus truncatus]|nr:N-chimaerin [Bulinus truncatus]
MSFMCQKDSYLKEFHTRVKSCHPVCESLLVEGKKTKVQGYNIVLEDTILFPEGGGQPDDRGTINDVPVMKVSRVGAYAVHFVTSEIPPETVVSLKLDWTRRFDHMQQHTAQHLITAVTDRKFGFQTTSWNLGTDIVTIELDTLSLALDQIREIEEAVNKSIRENISVKPTFYSDKDDPELKKFRGLGLPLDHVGPVRVLSIEGIDDALCCGTHVSNLSHIQAIKLLGAEKGKKNKVNLSFLAGERLLKYVGEAFCREKTLTGILKGPAEKHWELADKAVKSSKNMQKACNVQLRELATLEAALYKQMANKENVFIKHRFHGTLSRQEVDRLLQGGDGCYLVRKSDRAPDAFTLAIRFDGETKNYKLYYDGQHFVGEKRFDSIHDLVADGLIHFYIELRAADYIKTLSQESNYEESPYMAYNMKRKRMGKSKTDANVKGLNNEIANQANDDDDTCPSLDFNEFVKPHIFKLQNFMGLHWCDFCANFMWGLLAQGVKCQDCGFQAHKKCSEKVPNDCMPDMKYVKRIFGGDLTTVVKAQKSQIPIVVDKCVREIESRGMDMEGLYRLAGFHDDIEAVRMAFDKDAENADISINKYEDINTICSALKLYFRLLPIPLITCDVYKRLMEIIKTEDLTVSDQVKLMKEPLATLPPAHFHTLKFMCAHLGRVVEHKSKNMMSSENLAIVFAPTLLRSDDADPMASLMAAKF